jgi:PD-(D/E)XK nuclease superfamily
MPWARASAVERHLECGAASWLARADRGAWTPGYLTLDTALPATPPPADDSFLAEWGTNMHVAKEGRADAADPWLSWMDPVRETLWPSGLGKHEVPFGLCCATGIVLLWGPGDGDKDLWKRRLPPSYISGEADWLGNLPGGEPWVDDLKTGWYAPACTHPQLMLYALVAQKLSGYPTVRISVTHWRRGWETPERKWQQVGPLTLESFEDELRAAYRRATAGPDARPGPWCRYCPSAPVCPSVIGTQPKETT